MYVDFSLYFFATSAVVLLPFVYCVWRKLEILALFILACGYLTGLFFQENDFTAAYTLILTAGGVLFFFFEAVRQPEQSAVVGNEIQSYEETGGPDVRIHPKIKPMRRPLASLVKEFIVACPNCGGQNSLPEGKSRTICKWCGSPFEIPER